MPRLYLIRHGRPAAAWGSADHDPGLDEIGQAQARAARDWLLALPEAERPRRVVSSPLRRCRETAGPTAEALAVAIQIEPAVGEIPTPRAVAPEDRPAWLRRAFQGAWSEIEGDIDYEAWREQVVVSLLEQGGAAVFSHYVAINAVISHLSGDSRVLSFQPDHASITVLETNGRSLSLVAKGAQAATRVL
jgi:broad specificity phosphatase PhoE